MGGARHGGQVRARLTSHPGPVQKHLEPKARLLETKNRCSPAIETLRPDRNRRRIVHGQTALDSIVAKTGNVKHCTKNALIETEGATSAPGQTCTTRVEPWLLRPLECHNAYSTGAPRDIGKKKCKGDNP